MGDTIQIKRGNGVPTTDNIPYDGELAYDKTGKNLYINNDGTIEAIGGSGGSDNTYRVTFTSTLNLVATADKTAEEIYTAYNTGKFVFATFSYKPFQLVTCKLNSDNTYEIRFTNTEVGVEDSTTYVIYSIAKAVSVAGSNVTYALEIGSN